MTPGVLFLVSENAPSRVILGAGAGVFAVTHIGETPGVYLDESERMPETIAARFAEISDPATAAPLKDAFGQHSSSSRWLRRRTGSLSPDPLSGERRISACGHRRQERVAPPQAME